MVLYLIGVYIMNRTLHGRLEAEAEGYKIAGKDLLLVDSSDLRVFAT